MFFDRSMWESFPFRSALFLLVSISVSIQVSRPIPIRKIRSEFFTLITIEGRGVMLWRSVFPGVIWLTRVWGPPT